MTKKNLNLLLAGQFVSQIGDKFYALALAFWVLKTTGSAAKMGLVMFFSMAPAVLLGMVSGSIVDRYYRKNILIITDIFRAVVITGVLAAYYFGILTLPIIITAQVLLSLSAAFFDPTILSVIPQIVEKEEISKATGKSQLVSGLTSIIGPALGGLAVSYLGYGFIFGFNAVSFLISAIFASLIILPRISGDKLNESKIKDSIIEGYKYIVKRRQIIVIILIAAIVHLFVGSVQVIMPIFATKLQGNGPQNLGYIETAFGVGAVATAVILSVLSINNKEEKLMFTGIALIGLVYLAFGTLISLGFKVVFAFLLIFMLLSASVMITATSFEVILQKRIENHVAGRVFGIVQSVGNFSIPIAALTYGALLDRFELVYLVICSGFILLPLSIILYRVYRGAGQQTANASLTEN